MENNTSDKIQATIEEVKETVKETAEEAVAEVKEATADKDTLEEKSKAVLGAVAGALGKAGEVIKNVAEDVTKKDLDKDGKIGDGK